MGRGEHSFIHGRSVSLLRILNSFTNFFKTKNQTNIFFRGMPLLDSEEVK
jgi:hypothetical protein